MTTFLTKSVLLLKCVFLLALRKIVRNQSKMVQRPFSDDESNGNIVWRNLSQSHDSTNAVLMPPGYAQVKTLFHKRQRPKISTILSSVETGRSKSTYSRMKIARNEKINPFELRLARNTFNNLTNALQSATEESMLFPHHTGRNNSYPSDAAMETLYQIPTASKFFPTADERDFQSIEQKKNFKESSIVIPAVSGTEKENGSLLVKGIFIADKNTNDQFISPGNEVRNTDTTSSENDQKVDFLLEEVSTYGAAVSPYNFNITDNPYTCTTVQEIQSDIDASSQFSNFDIEVVATNNTLSVYIII